ncbi:RDD family protein [Streptomyces sp. PTY087I2]|uniref:RDD family protein n=1 Tax=Streptomyces sp. PTY087I2 TaxID=1819298 RepID=UPI00080BBECA|nr:RDD family protein [Streptomyces sp. PTY087I2]OCC09585.1 RDD family protein [Streptomyces sp. PTY087I2]
MSAPTPAPGDESPREGYYPDPSIPGYVRYWNGASWVPGTSRPAPGQTGPAATAPAPAAGAQSAPVEETGPIFFDEEEGLQGGEGAPPGSGAPAAGPADGASVWQADAARQNGFGGERDRRVEWGGPAQEPAGPGPGHPSPPADPRAPLAQDPTGGALPGMREGGGRPAEESGVRPPTDGTVTIRAVGPRSNAVRGGAPAAGDVPPGPAPSNAVTPQGPQNVSPAQNVSTAPNVSPAQNSLAQAPTPHALSAQAQPSAPAPAPAPAPTPVTTPSPDPGPSAALHTPLTPGPGGGSASWAQQVHRLAQPEPQQQLPHQQQGPAAGADQPVVPWKPPVDDPFQQLARNQASARPAGLGKRFAARLVDNLVLGAVVGAVAVPLSVRALDHIDRKITAAKETGETVTVWLLDSTTGALLGALLAAFLLLGFLLEALPTAKWGRTLGKKLFGLDVRDIESHDTPSLGAALRRWLVYGVLGLLVLGVVNVLWCLFDRPWRQCWHDKAARTFVAG